MVPGTVFGMGRSAERAGRMTMERSYSDTTTIVFPIEMFFAGDAGAFRSRCTERIVNVPAGNVTMNSVGDFGAGGRSRQRSAAFGTDIVPAVFPSGNVSGHGHEQGVTTLLTGMGPFACPNVTIEPSEDPSIWLSSRQRRSPS